MQEEVDQIDQYPVPLTMMKMSIPCSRCNHLISLRCCVKKRISIECEFKKMDDLFENIFNLTIGCPNYEEDLDISRTCLLE